MKCVWLIQSFPVKLQENEDWRDTRRWKKKAHMCLGSFLVEKPIFYHNTYLLICKALVCSLNAQQVWLTACCRCLMIPLLNFRLYITGHLWHSDQPPALFKSCLYSSDSSFGWLALAVIPRHICQRYDVERDRLKGKWIYLLYHLSWALYYSMQMS